MTIFSRTFVRSSAGLMSALFLTTAAQAATFVRWTKGQLPNPSIAAVAEATQLKTGFKLSAEDFVLDEERDLAFTHYQRYSQLIDGVRAEGASIRIWSDPGLIQAEANVEDPTTSSSLSFGFLELAPLDDRGIRDLSALLSTTRANSLAKMAIADSEDPKAQMFEAKDFLQAGKLVRQVTVTAKRGKHIVTIDLQTRKVLQSKYLPFPTKGGDSEVVRAMVYPVYEEYGGKVLERQQVVLRNLKDQVQRPGKDPFMELRAAQKYLYSKYSPTKAMTPEGQAQGFWSDRLLRQRVKLATKMVPYSANSYLSGFLLDGDFATLNINPEALGAFPGINFTPEFSTQPYWQFLDVNIAGRDDTEIITNATYFNKSFMSASDLYNASATHDPQHNPELYMNEGFDQIQVYYAIDKMFEVLHQNGWSDPELSTRPFNAILYNPDISMKDNAFYNADTINFTTYSEQNMARDNTTIWHELGHGVMDRLMGDVLTLADTGGLSEGMADFVAALVLQGAVGDRDFPGKQDQRIINKTGFYLTNEVHDDGESYGGVMKDILDASLATWSQSGLAMMTDLTFETMRLTRDHPALTAVEWFNHMLYADSLGRPGLRTPGQMHEVITAALNSRNFFETAQERGRLSIKFNETEVSAGQPGSRGNGIRLLLAPEHTKDLEIKLKIEDGEKYNFSYPVTMRVFYRTGPLQGAVHWKGEESSFQDFVVNASGEEHAIPLQVTGTCDFVNREDGSCVDYVYVHILQTNSEKAIAKKRFYVQVKPTPSKP